MLLFEDIDQLKLIMLLVGTPGAELLMKISSESVSFQLCLRVTPLFPDGLAFLAQCVAFAQTLSAFAALTSPFLSPPEHESLLSLSWVIQLLGSLLPY